LELFKDDEKERIVDKQKQWTPSILLLCFLGMKPSDVNAYDRVEDGESSKIQSQKEKTDQIVKAKAHKDVRNTSLPESPVEPANPLSEVKQEPEKLPCGYEWIICDLNTDDMCSEVCKFLKEQYPVDGQKFKDALQQLALDDTFVWFYYYFASSLYELLFPCDFFYF